MAQIVPRGLPLPTLEQLAPTSAVVDVWPVPDAYATGAQNQTTYR